MFYAKLGVAVVGTVVDGDCGPDVMNMMNGQSSSRAARDEMREAISDYLMARIGERWMHELMAACQELDRKDVNELWSGGAQTPVTLPIAQPPAVAAPAEACDLNEEDLILAVKPDEETFAAMRWASKLGDDCNVLSLIRSLPAKIVEEQVRAFRKKEPQSRNAEDKEIATKAKRITITNSPLLHTKMMVAERFHMYCRQRGLKCAERLPWGAMASFIKENIEWRLHQKVHLGINIKRWYDDWSSKDHSQVVAVADGPPRTRQEPNMNRSRAAVPSHKRQRCDGGGRHSAAPLVRQALYEWWAGLRFAIDWGQMATDRRSRGKKHLARFPRSVLVLKVRQLLEEHAYASLLTGRPVESITPNSRWFKSWEEDYGLSMRVANRKYEVSRSVQKERMEIFWVTLFRIRQFIYLVFGYDPLIMNFDQSPFHHNETGAQNKPVLGVKGAKCPIVEGNSDAKCRWTANLTTMSKFTAVADGPMPPAECMFKAEKDGSVDARAQEFLRSRGFPKWFTATVSPKGSYREEDVISFLRKHLELWTPDRDWRILLADDYSAHKTGNVWALCWSRGYILIIHGGGCTPVAQTVDTDLNQHTRRRYGNQESRLLIEKMRSGQNVPKLSNEECMSLMWEVLSDPQLHEDAAKGYKYVGQSVELHGNEDALICREAGTFWHEETLDGYTNMRAKINVELRMVADEVKSEGIQWCQRDVKRLITPYPKRKKADAILERLGEDFYHDDVHALGNDDDDDAAVAEGDQGAISDTSDDVDAVHVGAAVAEGDEVENVDELEDTAVAIIPLSAEQANQVHAVKASIAGIQSTIDTLRAIGSVRGVQCMETELAKERRKERQLVQGDPAVADAFLRLRTAEQQEDRVRMHAAAQQKQRKRDADKALADRDAAVAELKKTRRMIKDMEGVRASTHAIKTFTLEALGEGSANAGGAKSKKNRFEVLDRLARINAGLSAGQRNDWQWFKGAWDQRMVTEHGADWAATFSGWVQAVLDDTRSNALSLFVYHETCRVFHDISALHVPGG